MNEATVKMVNCHSKTIYPFGINTPDIIISNYAVLDKKVSLACINFIFPLIWTYILRNKGPFSIYQWGGWWGFDFFGGANYDNPPLKFFARNDNRPFEKCKFINTPLTTRFPRISTNIYSLPKMALFALLWEISSTIHPCLRNYTTLSVILALFRREAPKI